MVVSESFRSWSTGCHKLVVLGSWTTRALQDGFLSLGGCVASPLQIALPGFRVDQLGLAYPASGLDTMSRAPFVFVLATYSGYSERRSPIWRATNRG